MPVAGYFTSRKLALRVNGGFERRNNLSKHPITSFELTRFAGDVSSAVMPALPFSMLSTGLLLTSAVSNGVKADRNRSPTRAVTGKWQRWFSG